MTRTPARAAYDAIVDLFPPESRPELAYAIVKRVYRVVGQACVADDAEALYHDIRDPDIEPRLAPGHEFWPFKVLTDVGVKGSAFAPSGRPTGVGDVSVQIGKLNKRIRVFGRRLVEWSRDGQARIGAPEPFTEIPVTNENAYGGADKRVPVVPTPSTLDDYARLEFDHPGIYPRNPGGKGYLVMPEPIDGIELPNLEDPDDLLTDERLIVRDPKLWYRQPLAWSYDWMHGLMFPRFCYCGSDAWFPVPADVELEEVRRGYLYAHFRQIIAEADIDGGIHTSEFMQDASLGLRFQPLEHGTPVTVKGMHPDGEVLRFEVPPEPSIEFVIDGQHERVKPVLTNMLITPAEKKVSFVYAARTENLPRVFLPGIHGHIPLSVVVNGDDPVVYRTPKPIRERLEAAVADEPPHSELSIAISRTLTKEARSRIALRRDRHLNGRGRLPADRCVLVGQRVDAATGRVLESATDVELGGPLPLFQRYYSSQMSWRTSSLGHGWSHCFDQMVWVEEGKVVWRTADQREIEFDTSALPGGVLAEGDELLDPDGSVTLRRRGSGAWEVEVDGVLHAFASASSTEPGAVPERARLTQSSTRTGRAIALHYGPEGRLTAATCSDGRQVAFSYDGEGRLTELALPNAAGDTTVTHARYAYSPDGDLVEASDAAGRAQRYEYDAHRLASATDRSGANQRYTYDGPGPLARCIHTVDDESRPRKLKYGGGRTVITDDLGLRLVYEVEDGRVASMTDQSTPNASD